MQRDPFYCERREKMGVRCGTQVVLCNLPIRFDTYEGCSHACKYCFAQKKRDIAEVKGGGTVKSLRSFIEGKRNGETDWADWNIPLHWGGMSDPFQPVEKELRNSYECLKVFAETGYPFVVSTKGSLVADDEYLELLKRCNCVVQISMVCGKYDRIETGAPSYEERLKILEKVSGKVKRTIVRVQPYMLEVRKDVMKNIPRIAEAGAHGVILEGMKFYKKKPGLEKLADDFVYPLERLKMDFESIKDEAHRNGMKFYSGENRLRMLGDDPCCCGIDGLEGFKGNDYNICMLINGQEPEPTERMKEIGSGMCFSSLFQTTKALRQIRNMSFYGIMQKELMEKPDYYREVFGIGKGNKRE